MKEEEIKQLKSFWDKVVDVRLRAIAICSVIYNNKTNGDDQDSKHTIIKIKEDD